MDSQNNITPINGKALAKPHTGSQMSLQEQAQEALRPASITEVIATLARNLALVRPVGMAQKDADEWLRVAAAELQHLPPDILAQGASKARASCNHHGQIVPAIFKETAEWLGARRSIATPAPRADRTLPAPDRWVPEPGELEAIKRAAAESLRADR